ncbi:hypothetical protein K0M31_012583 [Melipona bicolor]|uniref:Uncharacterized protein n=1 Tax=Melipona bicolor TaxID=60889 RepID=A0AA40KHF9_9HYME|nr:hypothetical protein K0M31_012583 [Melipona bicolor]
MHYAEGAGHANTTCVFISAVSYIQTQQLSQILVYWLITNLVKLLWLGPVLMFNSLKIQSGMLLKICSDYSTPYKDIKSSTTSGCSTPTDR